MSKDDEVELGGGDAGEDFEMVPVGPIRKLERRIDEMEQQKTSSGNDELVRDVLDIMKSNQKIVNDMTESTHELKNSVEDLTHKMDDVVDNMNSFMDLLEQASEADLEGEVIQDVHTRIADAVGNEMEAVAEDIKTSNEEVVDNLESLNQSIKRSYTSQDKSNILSSDSQRMNPDRGGNNQGRQGQRDQREDGSGMNIDRGGDRQNRDGDSSPNSNRMRKLRKRFDKNNDE